MVFFASRRCCRGAYDGTEWSAPKVSVPPVASIRLAYIGRQHMSSTVLTLGRNRPVNSKRRTGERREGPRANPAFWGEVSKSEGSRFRPSGPGPPGRERGAERHSKQERGGTIPDRQCGYSGAQRGREPAARSRHAA